MKTLFLSFILFFTSLSFAQTTTADPAYANMQRAIGGIVQSSVASRGYVASNPATYATLSGIGGAAAGAAATAGTGLLLGLSAPAWGTVLGVAAVSGAVSYAVSLGLDKLSQWVFGSDGAQTSSPGWQATFTCTSSVPNNSSQCTESGIEGRTCSAVGQIDAYTWRIYCQAGAPTLSDPQPLSALAPAVAPSTLSSPVDYQAMSLMINDLWQKASQQQGYQGVPYSTTQPVTAQQVQTWAQANPAAYPTVEALLSPVASSQSAVSTGTGFYPSTTTAVGTPVSPATQTQTSTQTGTTSNTTNNTTNNITNITNNTTEVTQTVDLGPNPGTPSPTIDSPDWLQPLLDMLPGWRTASFTAQGECLTPTVDLNPFINKTITMSSHCDLFESQRQTLSVIMAFVWVMVAAFIVLRA